MNTDSLKARDKEHFLKRQAIHVNTHVQILCKLLIRINVLSLAHYVLLTLNLSFSYFSMRACLPCYIKI